MLQRLFTNLTESTRWHIYNLEFKKFIILKNNTVQQFVLKYSQLCIRSNIEG